MIAIIQAGGQSSRMGEDKAWIVINGRPMIEHVIAAAQKITTAIAVIINPANPDRKKYEALAESLSANLMHDLHDHRGPLGGIETGLQFCGAEKSALILACDLPFVSTEFLRLLQQIHQTENSLLTVPLDQAGRPQMLAAIYSPACLPHVSDLLAGNELKARLLCQRVKTRLVDFSEYSYLPEAEKFLVNLNTPEELQTVASNA